MTIPIPVTHAARYLAGALAILLMLTPTRVHGQTDPSNFTTVIDLMPSLDPVVVGSDTQVNVSTDGGYGDLTAAPGATNIEVNIYAGYSGGNLDVGANNMSVVNLHAIGEAWSSVNAAVVNVYGGVADFMGRYDPASEGGFEYNLYGGNVGFATVEGPRSVANLLGGTADIVDLNPGGAPLPSGVAGPTLNMSSGVVYHGIMVRDNSTANLRGGSLGPSGAVVSVDAMGVLNLFVTELAIDGTPQNLTPGVSTPILTSDTGPDRVTTPLSGVFADGSPFVFDATYFGGASLITATRVVPEPGTLTSLVALSAAVLLGRRRLSRVAA